MKKNKTIKKIMTGLLTFCMVFSAGCITAFANTTDLTENSKSGTTTVEYNVDSSWTASIPAYINPSEQGNADIDKYEVTLSDVMLGNSATLIGTVEYDGKLIDVNNVELDYVLCDEKGEIASSEEIIFADAGNPDATASYKFGAELNENPKFAGNYLGIAAFNFTVNERVFAIGKTKSENVIAKFNEDFSQVDIFTAANDSDGIMRDFDGDSPMRNQAVKLETAVIKKGVTNIGSQAFDKCDNLTSIAIPNTVTSIANDSFNECDSLTTIYGSFNSFAEDWATNNDYYFQSNDVVYTAEDIENNEYLLALGKTKAEYVVAKFNDDFSEATIFANGKDSDGVMADAKDYNGLFSPYTNTLTSVLVESGVSTIGKTAFANCAKITNISLPEGIISIGDNAFYRCAFKNITLPNGIKSIGESAFQYCTSLKSIVIPDSVSEIGSGVFSDCVSLENVTISNALTAIESYMFYGCSSIRNITIPSSVFYIRNYAFKNCSSLENVIFSDTETSIGANAFENCSALKNVTLTNVDYIGSCSFQGCSSLESITILNKTSSIQGDFLKDCTNLNTVYGYSGSSAESWAKIYKYNFVAID